MFLFCVLALVLGAVLATAVSVIYLAVGLIVLTVAGAIEAYWIGVPLGKVLLWAIALFAIAQIGYVAERRSSRYFRPPAGTLPPTPLSKTGWSLAPTDSRADVRRGRRGSDPSILPLSVREDRLLTGS